MQKIEKKSKKAVDISTNLYYTYVRNRGVAQFGRALRSGRRGRKFESCRLDLYKSRPVGQAVKTTPSHGVNPGSIPGQVICCCIMQQHFLKVLPWLSW